jgi:hypothetical protein
MTTSQVVDRLVRVIVYQDSTTGTIHITFRVPELLREKGEDAVLFNVPLDEYVVKHGPSLWAQFADALLQGVRNAVAKVQTDLQQSAEKHGFTPDA